MGTLSNYPKGVIPAVVFLFLMANLAFGETKVFVEKYTYQASEADSKLSSRAIAFGSRTAQHYLSSKGISW